jgi:hypothetical protein
LKGHGSNLKVRGLVECIVEHPDRYLPMTIPMLLFRYVPKYKAASPTVSVTRPLLRVSGNASGETMVNPDNKISFIAEVRTRTATDLGEGPSDSSDVK